MRHATTPVLLLACACSAWSDPDEGKLGETGLEEREETGLDTGGGPVDRVAMSFSVALQRGDWGGSLTRCQVELAFMEEGERDGLFASTGGRVIELPTEPGSCAFTSFYDEQASDGLWSVQGSRRAGDSVWLHGDGESIELALERDSRGRYRYVLADCDASSFPFARVLDLEVPGWDGEGGVEGFEADDAFVTGPDLGITSLPGELDEEGRLPLAAGEDLPVAWSTLQPLPEVDGEPATWVPYLMLRNFHPGDPSPIEALACLPGDDQAFTIPSEELARLTPSESEGPGDPDIGFQVDSWTQGPELDTPWHTSARVISAVSEGGILLLGS